jgi:Raf kinase inhibitor-like YbhB/YbcL family protein
LTSPALEEGGTIPPRFTCEGEDRSPPLEWTAVEGAGAWALIMDDLDANFVQWYAWDLPADTLSLPLDAVIGQPAREGQNGRGEPGYAGPCPPQGAEPHRYQFTVFALDAPLGLPAAATLPELRAALEGHILATGRLTATFAR